jgi:hypothetical protein
MYLSSSAASEAACVPSTVRGPEGDLVLVRITADAKHLEEVLEAIAELPFPINPEINHTVGGARRPVVEFPAYSQRVSEVRDLLRDRGLPDVCTLDVVPQYS